MADRSLTRCVAAVRRRLGVAAWLGEWARVGAVALVAAGVAALLARRFLDWSVARSLWFVLLLLPAAAIAAWRARRRLLSPTTVATWLDVQGGADGRWVTAFELDGAPPAASRSFDPDAALDSLRLRWSLLARPLLPALAFLIVALWLPLPAATTSALDLPQLQAAQLDRLAEKLATLEETVQLDEELRAELRDRLDRAREQSDDAPLASRFEAYDQLATRLEQEAEAAREEIELAQAALASDELSRALSEDAGRAQELLGATLDELAAAGLTQPLPDELQEALSDALAGLDGAPLPDGMKLDPATLAALSKQLEGALGTQLAKLVESGLIDLSKLRPFEGKLVEHVCTDACKKKEGGG